MRKPTTIIFIFITVPTSPNSINAHAISPTSISVKWSNLTSALTSFNISAYSVMYRDTSSTTWQSLVVQPTVKEAYLTRLHPYTLYTLRVTALTFNAMGMPSKLHDVQTKQGGKFQKFLCTYFNFVLRRTRMELIAWKFACCVVIQFNVEQLSLERHENLNLCE